MKSLIFLISIYLYLCFASFGGQKENIMDQINNLTSLEFNFSQEVNDKLEKGSCLLEFPGKLKCNYYDNKQKEIIINNRKLSVTQKRYNKTYFYPFAKSPFLNILYKENLLDVVKSGTLKKSKENLELTFSAENEITILFNKDNFELNGWKIIDQYNNEINFNLKINAKNIFFPKNTFKLPKVN